VLKLYIIEGPSKGKSFNLDQRELSLGRGPGNTIQIDDPSISQNHMRLEKRQGRYYVEDLKSTNGTFMNGDMLAPGRPVEIIEGVPIAAGNTLMVLDRAFSVGGTLVHHAVHFPVRERKTKGAVYYKDRPMTNPKNLQLLYNISHVLMESIEIDDVLEKLMGYLFDCLKRIDRGAILLYDDATGKLTEIIARNREGPIKNPMEYSNVIVERVIETTMPVFMSDTSKEEEKNLSDSMKVLNIRSVMCVPLISRGNLQGVIYVDSLDEPHGFRKEDLYLLVGLSSPAAVAIENALLYANQEKLVESRTRSLRRTEQKLRKSEARFRAIFDNMKTGVVVYENDKDRDDFTIVDLNRSAQKIEHIEKEKAIGKPLRGIFPEYAAMGLLPVFKKVWKTGVSEHIDPIVCQGSERSGWRVYDVYRLPSGEIVELFSDVTDQKRAEEEQHILQERLLNAQKLESVGRLAGGVAHNFRNILQAILGNMEFLEMMYENMPEISEVVRNIDNSITKGVDLVNSLMQFSKAGTDFRPVVTELSQVIQETYGIVERLFDKKIQVVIEVEQGLLLKGNRSMLSQVFMNLFTNARDAMPEGGRLFVTARKDGDEIEAVVSDTGYGMDKVTLDQIFDPFFTGKEVGKGTGLGLSTVHGIVEEHGGTISVASAPGKGATFRIRFPQTTKTSGIPKVLGKDIVTGKGQKILVVDDEPGSLDALVGMIQSLGYNATGVSRSADAVEQYNTFQPDAVLMDRNMPEIDGISCIRELLRLDEEARIAIVSGYESSGPNGIDEDVKKMIMGYLTKPCGLEELSEVLSEVLERETNRGQ
jgi:signal transduction histidine kinase/CheY-like chemotaxis protein/pSer/pThr/pTyr-binding forkhead associated (FHA) protein